MNKDYVENLDGFFFIDEFNGVYAVNKDGVVVNAKTLGIMKPRTLKTGCVVVRVTSPDGRKVDRSVAKLKEIYALGNADYHFPAKGNEIHRDRNDKIVEMSKSGLSANEIDRRLCICRGTSSSVLRMRGIDQSHMSGKQRHADAVARHGGTEESYKEYRRYLNNHHWTRTRAKDACEKSGADYDKSVNLKSLIEREGLTCKICGRLCDTNDKTWGVSGPNSPSLDHIIPLSKGGSHTWDNVQVAHHRCNTLKGAKVEVNS